MKLTFDSLHVSHMLCLNDSFMAVRDGLDCSSSILARVCDKHADFVMPLSSSGNTMSVEIFGQFKGAGFSARYQAFDLSNGGRTRRNIILYLS